MLHFHKPPTPQHPLRIHILQHIRPGGQGLHRQYGCRILQPARRIRRLQPPLRIQDAEGRAGALWQGRVFEKNVEELLRRVGEKQQARAGRCNFDLLLLYY